MNIALEGIAETRLTMGGKPTPFGIDVSELDAAMDLLRDQPKLSDLSAPQWDTMSCKY